MAAALLTTGLSLLPENIEPFAKFEEVVSSTIPEHLLIPEINIDTELSFGILQAFTVSF